MAVVCRVVETDSRPTSERVVGEIWVVCRETVKDRFVADLALIVSNLLQVTVCSVMLSMARGAGKLGRSTQQSPSCSKHRRSVCRTRCLRCQYEKSGWRNIVWLVMVLRKFLVAFDTKEILRLTMFSGDSQFEKRVRPTATDVVAGPTVVFNGPVRRRHAARRHDRHSSGPSDEKSDQTNRKC